MARLISNRLGLLGLLGPLALGVMTLIKHVVFVIGGWPKPITIGALAPLLIIFAALNGLREIKGRETRETSAAGEATR